MRVYLGSLYGKAVRTLLYSSVLDGPLDGCEMLLSSLQQCFMEKGLPSSPPEVGRSLSDERCAAVPSPGYLGGEGYGVEEAWYFTKAMAASSLQNSSSTITPSSKVMWSTIGPSGSKPSNRFLTSRSLGVKS